MQPYLLPSFVEEDSDAVDSLLFFERMAYKADLLSSVIDSNHSVADALSGTVPEDLVGICEVSREQCIVLAGSDLSSRFDRNLDDSLPSTSDSPRSFDDVIPTSSSRWVDCIAKCLERRSGWIPSSSRFGRKNCEKLIVDERLMGQFIRCMDVQMLIHRTIRFIAQAEHLAEIHLEESSLDLVEREISYIAVLDLDFDTIAAAIGFTKQALVTVISAAGSSTLGLHFWSLTRISRFDSQCRGLGGRRCSVPTATEHDQSVEELQGPDKVSSSVALVLCFADLFPALGNFYDDWMISPATRVR